MNSYVLRASDNAVFCNGEPLPLCLDIYSHSPTGFSWGYEGSGPAQLALAIMVKEYGADVWSHPVHYQDLKRDLIAKFHPENDLEFSSQLVFDSVAEIGWGNLG